MEHILGLSQMRIEKVKSIFPSTPPDVQGGGLLQQHKFSGAFLSCLLHRPRVSPGLERALQQKVAENSLRRLWCEELRGYGWPYITIATPTLQIENTK